MTASNPNVDATFYVQIEPDYYTHLFDGEEPKVRSAKAARMTQQRPTKQAPNTVLVKLTIRLPRSAFAPLRPEAVVVIPAGYTDVVVEAGDAHQEE